MGWNKRAERAETKAMFWEEEYHAQKAEIERLRTDCNKMGNHLRAEIERLRKQNRELLAALEQIIQTPEVRLDEASYIARAAIAKAEGHT